MGPRKGQSLDTEGYGPERGQEEEDRSGPHVSRVQPTSLLKTVSFFSMVIRQT